MTTWKEWAGWMADAFGLAEWNARTLKVWIDDVFVPGGATPEEMKEAALAVLRNGPPGKPHEILKALTDELRRNRAVQIHDLDADQRRGESESSGCPWCGGTGWAVVPRHPQPPPTPRRHRRDDDDDSPPPLATCAVQCRCGAGQALQAKDHRGEPAMTLTQYEARNPGWVLQLEQERKRVRAHGVAWVSCRSLVERVAEWTRHNRDQ